MPEGYDFAGWVTKNDIRCSDGVTIKRGAFKHHDQKKVPLVWNHNHNDAKNILGHVLLEDRDEGVYGYGYLNETEEGSNAKELVTHGDIAAMSIAANRLKKQAQNVIHGMIYEVSLVLAGANPGALIESVVKHSDDGEDVVLEDKAIIYTDNLVHSAEIEDEILNHKENGDNKMAGDKTIGDVLDTLSEEQTEAVTALIANMIEDGDLAQSDDLEENELKHNVFDGDMITTENELKHSEIEAVFNDAQRAGSLKNAMLQHGINNIELLFPEATVVGDKPFILRQQNTAAAKIVDATHKSPFSKVKNMIADLTADEARAKGYIKGNEKFEQMFELLTRETGPQTIYKKQKLDRDDIIDITDYDIVGFINMELKMMLKEELARAIMVGDGREVTDPDKIKAANIRPIVTDDDLYAIKKTMASAEDVIETVIRSMALYEGSGVPSLYMSPNHLADIKLMKKADGSFLFGEIPTKESIAARLGVSEIVPSTFFKDQMVIVNLSDYTIGATKGGELTTFDDFDIDFNQYKYLIETRLSGALTIPHSAIVITVDPAYVEETPVAG